MSFEPLEKIANAVLYEGFMLYPYRKSSVKNQQRWHFGTIGPVGGTDNHVMQTECLVESQGQSAINVKIRFLQQEIEREVEFCGCWLGSNAERHNFSFPPLEGKLDIASARVSEGVFRLSVRIENSSERPEAASSMLSAHTLLEVRDGAFLSLLDPPEEHQAAAAACTNIGTWPVLAGPEGDRTLMFSSPIILYDYPKIAPESAGDMFDGTEIDEILTLRVLTLSEEERKEVWAGDDRARGLLERTEALPPEALAKMHGAIRSLRNTAKLSFREGDRVRLRPRKKADIFDIALAGKIAIVESVERDFENNVHLAVTVEDDPGREFGVARQIGHRFFFGPEEVELL
jgi:hypothetical protein